MRSDPPLRIAGGRVFEPARGVDVHADLCLAEGIVRGLDLPRLPDERVVDAAGCLVTPGFVDLHTHLREPGQTHKETIASGTSAAAAGGFTTVCAMANTAPVTDAPERVEWVRRSSQERACVRVLPVAAVTVGLSGRELVPVDRLVAAGARAFSDDGHPILDERLFEDALRCIGGTGATISVHAEDTTRGQPGIDARVAAQVGCIGIDADAEIALVRSHLGALERVDGARLHIAHVTTAEAVEAIRVAKARGLAVTAEATPHHLALTFEALAARRFALPGDPYAKVNPPLRSTADRAAVVAGLADGTIDAVATDHAPHAVHEKAVPLAEAPSGLTGLELTVPVVWSLVRDGAIELDRAVDALTAAPCRVFGLPFGSLAPGAVADIAVIDPDAEWLVAPGTLRSRGTNTPLVGTVVRGRAVLTVHRGAIVHADTDTDRYAYGGG